MLATDPLVNEYFPHYLPSEEELSVTEKLVAGKPQLQEQLQEFVAINADVKATLRRFCWQAKQDGLQGGCLCRGGCETFGNVLGKARDVGA